MTDHVIVTLPARFKQNHARSRFQNLQTILLILPTQEVAPAYALLIDFVVAHLAVMDSFLALGYLPQPNVDETCSLSFIPLSL